MAITQLLWANNAATKLASPLTSSSTSATLSTGTGALFPNPSAGQYFLLTLNDALTGLVYEIVKVTARAGDVLTIVRGQEGTAAVAWLANDLAVNMWTAGSAAWLVQESQLQANSYCYAADTGTVNNIVIALTPAITAPNPNAPIYFSAANANTGATTITVNGGTTYNLIGRGKSALQGGEIAVNSFCCAEYDSVSAAYVLLWSTGGAQPVSNATQSAHAVNLGQIVTQAGTAFATGGTAPAYTLTPSPALTAYAANQRFRVAFGAAGTTGSNTLNISGLGAKNLMQYGPDGVLVAAVIPAAMLSDVEYNGTNMILLDPVASGFNSQQSIAAAVASNALTLTYNGGPLAFRNATLTNGTPVNLSVASNSITVPSGATLGTVSGQAANLVLLEAYNGGTPVACVANLAGGLDLSETNLISPTTISGSSNSNNVIYSASVVSANSPYRVVGYATLSEATAGTWASQPTLVQGLGGEALAALQSFGYGQTWQAVTGSRALGTTYYNTTGRPRQVIVSANSTSASALMQSTVNGLTMQGMAQTTTGINASMSYTVPPGGSYSTTMTGTATIAGWYELG